MKKLRPKDIDDLLADYYDGMGLTELAKIYRVTKGTIYYHIKIKSRDKKILNPICYLEHVENHIRFLEEKIKSKSFSHRENTFMEAEIANLKAWLKVDRSRLPAEPFVLQ